jgi:NADPH:quinone reductase
MTTPAEMTAIEIAAPGGPEVLQPVRLPVPQPGQGEVLIRVAAAGINAPDLAQRSGRYQPPPDASPLPGLEVSGELVQLGEDVAGWSLGDRVVALTNGGGYAEYALVPAGQVLRLPEGWHLVAGAALPETFFTVQQTLFMRAGLAAGMDVLIHGAAGGIGGAAIQMAHAMGARPIASVSSPEKAAYAMSLGAVAAIEHPREDFVARTLALTGGKGADRILDLVGGPYTARNLAAAARGGHIVQVASMSTEKSELDAGQLVMRQLTISGSTLRPQSRETKAAIAAGLLETIWPALDGGTIRTPRLCALPLARAADGHIVMGRRDNYGKVLLLTAFGEQLLEAGPLPDNSIEIL